MFQKIIHFIKYNNATVIILAIILILGGGALAAGPEAIGEKQSRIEGVDNSALLAADLENFNMDFKIENIQQDEKYYYVTYSFMDIVSADNVWQYQLSQRTQKISKKIKDDLGLYMAKFLAKHYEARTRELKAEKALAESAGEQKRIEITEYSGLIGRSLDLAAKVFPGYEAVKKIELPTPDFDSLPTPLSRGGEEGLSLVSPASGADNLTQIYNDYLAAHDRDADGVLDAADNCPDAANLDQLDTDGDGAGDLCDNTLDLPANGSDPAGETASSTPESSTPAPSAIDEPITGNAPAVSDSESVDIIELPAPPAEPSASEPTVEPAPAE